MLATSLMKYGEYMAIIVQGLLAENGQCPTAEMLKMPNVVRGFVYQHPETQALTHCFLGEPEMDLSIQDHYLMPDGQDISVYTSKKDPDKPREEGIIPPTVFTARIMVAPSLPNPLLQLPFYHLEQGTLQPC
jgi:hypothetical protein